MNQVFSCNRWLLLVRKHWSENRKKYMLGLLAVAGIMAVWFAFILVMSPREAMHSSYQYVTYYVGLFIVGCLYGSTLFAELSSKPKGINYLSVPASHLEKVLTTFLYGVLLFFVCYTLVFYLVDIIMVKLANAISYSAWQKNSSNYGIPYQAKKVVNVFWGEERAGRANVNIAFSVFLAYLAVQAAYILGSVYFVKFSFIKTTIALIFIWLLVIVFADKVLGNWLPQGRCNEGFSSYWLYGENISAKVVRLPDWINAVVLFLLKYSFAPVFWVVTYFRLKEKEI